jgi:hypothetical protein
MKHDAIPFVKAYAVAEDRINHPGTAREVYADIWEKKTPRQRLRELRGEARGGYSELLQFQVKVTELCTVLEDFDVQDFNHNEDELGRFRDIRDDLVSLGIWLDQQLTAVARYVDTYATVARIIHLRNPWGRTPPEAESARKYADKLERQLGPRALRAGE